MLLDLSAIFPNDNPNGPVRFTASDVVECVIDNPTNGLVIM